MRKLLATVFVTCAVALAVPAGMAFADDLTGEGAALTSGSVLSTAASNVKECNVIDYGAVPNDSLSDAGAINAALREARSIASGTTVHVIVPKGEYHLSEPLRMYSNTTMTLDPQAKIIADYGNQEMLNGLHVDPATGANCAGKNCTHGGYSQLSNITIEGGTWEGKQSSSKDLIGNMSIFMLRHGHDITIRNTTVKYAATHFFNLASTQNVLVENVTFQDAQQVTNPNADFWGENGIKRGDMNSYNAVEAIHLDTCDGVGESGAGAMPLDCTPCNKVTVQNCTFDNVWSGVGNHHPAKDQKKRSSDIKVLNNTFKNIRYYAFYAINFDKVTLQGNTITNASGITSLRGCTQCKIVKNKLSYGKAKAGKYDPSIVKMKLPSINVVSAKKFDIQGNNISNSLYRGIRVQDSATVNVTSNKVQKAAEKGIYVTGTTGCTLKSNTVKAAQDFGMQVDGGKKIVLQKNTITNSKLTGMRIAKCKSATISNNKVSGSKEKGIFTSDSTSTIKNNTVANTKDVGIRVAGGKASIQGNKVTSSGMKAMQIDGQCKQLKITSNTVKGTKYHGIVVYGCNGAKISGNKVSKVPERGISLQDSVKAQIIGNTVTVSGDAVYLAGTSTKNCCTATIKNNKLSSLELHDLKLGAFALRCKLSGNTLEHGSFSCSSDASYTGTV